MRHAPYAVTPDARDRWLAAFRAGLDAAELDPEDDARFWEYVTYAAQSMVNTLDTPQPEGRPAH
jgi:hemoglobin